jgi:hypothetical protein
MSQNGNYGVVSLRDIKPEDPLPVDFTKSVGGRDTTHAVSFSDLIEFGGFQFEQKIKSVARIEVFSNKLNQDATVIVGLRNHCNHCNHLSDNSPIPSVVAS